VGGAILKAIVPLCFAALVLVACSEEPDKPDRGTNDATVPGGGAGETGKARTMAEEGALSPGRYFTEGEFEPSFSFEIGEGWRVLPSLTSHSLKLGHVTPGNVVAEGKALRFLNVREVFEPREADGEVSFEVKPAPGDMVAWFQRHPYLSTDEPEPVDIGGVAGKRLDVEVNVPEGYRDDQGGGCAVPCVPLFRLGDDSVTHITEMGKDRFAVLEDVRGEAVVIIVSAPVIEFDEFLPEAQKVLDTVEWEGA
jgi:hypothetical protein